MVHRIDRLDPYTDAWAALAGDLYVPVYRSRFEVDLDRPRNRAIYRTRDDAWGLQVWHAPLPHDVAVRSLALYDTFYGRLGALLRDALARFGWFVVLDLHSYNHRRAGIGAPPDDPASNPAVNIGTDGMRDRWPDPPRSRPPFGYSR